MNTYTSLQESSSVPSISDLDGYTLRDYSFPMTNSYASTDQDDFGFDPPDHGPVPHKIENSYNSPDQNDNMSLGGWPEFEREVDAKSYTRYPDADGSFEIPTKRLEKLLAQKLPHNNTAISRYGQVTPPRSNSTPSNVDTNGADEATSPKTIVQERPRRTKAQPKVPQAPPPATSGRKRKSTRKAAAGLEPIAQPEESKRKQSLEKNRLAAAKCRVNKKEKTEQLQRNSHDKALRNNFLKEQVVRMKEQIQQMNAILLAHANCDGCKSPSEIQQHLSELGNDFFAQHMSLPGHSFGEFPPMSLSDLPQIEQDAMLQDGYFGTSHHSNHNSSMLHPPLPEFNRSAEFEVLTPMQAD